MILGGLAQGLGNGLTQYGMQLRDAKLQAIARETRTAERAEDRTFRSEEASIDRAFRAEQSGLDRRARADLQDDAQAFSSETLSTKLDADKPLSEARTRLTNAEADNLEKGIGRGGSGAAVANRENLQAIYMNSNEGQRQEGESEEAYRRRINDWILKIETQRDSKSDQDLWLEAVKMAQNDPTVSLKGEEAVEAKAEQLFKVMKGRKSEATQPAPVSGSNRGQADGANDAGGKPSGAGTEEDPFMATSQSQIDWFKQNAPEGAVINVNGKLYRK